MFAHRTIIAVLLALVLSPAMAAQGGFDQQKLYFGAGLSQNEVSGSDNGTGFQIFGGYELLELTKDINLDVEVGYMDTGDMDVEVCRNVPLVGRVCAQGDASAEGLWAAAVGRLKLNPQFHLLGRVGYDFGDDDGLLFGIGAGMTINKQFDLRLEYVERDHVESLQLNLIFRLM